MSMKIAGVREWLRDWVVKHAQEANARIWLAGLSFAEASFFPIPPDVLLIAMLIVKSKDWVQLALLTTTASVLGGALGYAIGALFFDFVGEPLVALYNLQDDMEHVRALFADNAFMAIFLAAFTPIPFKVFTIAGGLFKIPFITFIVAAFLGRGIRFFTEGYLMKLYGKKLGNLVYTYFNAVTTVFLVLILTLILLSL